jgi:predicted dehydrogenase
VKVGIIGCGAIAELRARALCGRGSGSGARLVAVSDADPDRASAFARRFGARVLPGVEALVSDREVEAVIVSTPPVAHGEGVLAALSAGRSVLCEKPLAPDPLTARQMVEEAKRRNLPLMCGFNHRFFPAVSSVRELLRAGQLGALDRIRAYAGHSGAPEFSTSWITDRRVVGGGALMDNGIHIVDLVRHLAGEIVEVMARVSSRVYRLEVEDNATVQMVAANGCVIALEASWTDWSGYSFWVEACGDRGLARAAYPPMRSVYVQRPDGGRPRKRWKIFPKVQIAERLGSWRATVVETFRREHAEWLGVLDGHPPDVAATGADGARAVEIAAAAYESSRTGRPVSL